MHRVATLLVTLAFCFGGTAAAQYSAHTGDIIFHTSRSSQSLAVQQATHSRYSHMGIVFVQDGAPFVFEAVQSAKFTPLAAWIRRGEGGHYVAKRLRNADHVLTASNVTRLAAEAKKLEGKKYDLYFEWSDERMYCSDLVWKIYQRATGLQIGRTQQLRDFDLSSPAVKEKIQQRWRGSPPLNETVVSPIAMFQSDQLVTVAAQ